MLMTKAKLFDDLERVAKLFFKKWTNPGLFLLTFGLFKQTKQFLQQINVKNVHPVYGTGIQIHDLRNMSLLI